MTKRSDQLDRIEQALHGIAEVQSSIAAALDPDVKGSLAAQLIAEAKSARSSSESAFASVQALAAYITAKPGLGELAGAVATNTEAIRGVPAAVAKALQAAAMTAGSVAARAAGPAERPAPPADGPGTAGKAATKPKGM